MAKGDHNVVGFAWYVSYCLIRQRANAYFVEAIRNPFPCDICPRSPVHAMLIQALGGP